jgi:hypothetical protein
MITISMAMLIILLLGCLIVCIIRICECLVHITLRRLDRENNESNTNIEIIDEINTRQTQLKTFRNYKQILRNIIEVEEKEKEKEVIIIINPGKERPMLGTIVSN